MRPILEHLVTVPTPVVLLNATRVTDDDLAYVSSHAFVSNARRQLVPEVCRAPRQRLTRPLRFIARTVLSFGVVLLLLEVVLILAQRIPRIQYGFLWEGDGGCHADAEVNACNLVSGRFVRDFHLVYDMDFVRGTVPDSPDLADFAHLTVLWFLVIDDNVFSRSWRGLVVCALGEAESVVLFVMPNSRLLPRDRGPRMLLMNEIPFAIVVPVFSVAWRVISVVVGVEPVTEGVSELF